jgi:hypothetical protein
VYTVEGECVQSGRRMCTLYTFSVEGDCVQSTHSLVFDVYSAQRRVNIESEFERTHRNIINVAV